jgi:hypothetical protein
MVRAFQLRAVQAGKVSPVGAVFQLNADLVHPSRSRSCFAQKTSEQAAKI